MRSFYIQIRLFAIAKWLHRYYQIFQSSMSKAVSRSYSIAVPCTAIIEDQDVLKYRYLFFVKNNWCMRPQQQHPPMLSKLT